MKYIISQRQLRTQKGFTIVELMVATVVFSVILLVITSGVLHFSNAYYKGINSSTTQDKARSIVDTVSQAIQFSGTTIAGTDDTAGSYFCAGNQVYVFKPGAQYLGGASTATNPGLYVTSQSGGCGLPGAYDAPNSRQLLSPHLRIVSMSVTNVGWSSGSPRYKVSLLLAYSSGGNPALDGNDLLCAPIGTPGSCSSSTPLPNASLNTNDVTCKSQTGSQFCAVSALSTTVQQRLTGSNLD